jgi:hypothetical protein
MLFREPEVKGLKTKMNRVILALLIFAYIATLVYPSQTVRDKNRGWRPGSYRGLTVGKSTGADMLRVLGKPLSSTPSADQDPPEPIIWNDYGTIQVELPGRLGVELDSRNNRIVSISISPENMSKEEAIKYFGKNYILMGYEFCEGLPIDAEVGPVYENPKSSEIDYLEYRSKGIAIHLNYQGMVNTIYYVSAPMGLASRADCGKAVRRYRRNSGHE